MVDSLDTMLLLGLEDEFQRAVSHIASMNFTMPEVSLLDLVRGQLMTRNLGSTCPLL